MWGTSKYPIRGVENIPCAGGVYMQPKSSQRTDYGTVVSVEMEVEEGKEPILCVILESNESRASLQTGTFSPDFDITGGFE